MEKDKGNEPW